MQTKATAPTMSIQEEAELRLLAMTNENAELRMQLHRAKQDEFTKSKQLAIRNEELRKEVANLRTSMCEWVCLACNEEYYGPAAVERGSFKCIACKGKGVDRYCVPKHFLPQAQQQPVATVTAIAEKAAA